MSTPYKALARFYNNLIQDDSYKSYAKMVVGLIQNYSKTKTGIDAACGSGTVTRLLKGAGYDILGVDISEDMLKCAQEISNKERLNIGYLKQDIRALKTFKQVGFITCINDGLNYVETKDLLKTFKSFNKCLLKGGVLVFDVSTEYKMQNVLDGQMYGDNGEDVSYMWMSDFNKQDKNLTISLTFFEKDGKVYNRYDEEQVQYAHSVLDIEEALKGAGFTIKSVTNECGLPFEPTHQSAVFTAIKE